MKPGILRSGGFCSAAALVAVLLSFVVIDRLGKWTLDAWIDDLADAAPGSMTMQSIYRVGGFLSAMSRDDRSNGASRTSLLLGFSSIVRGFDPRILDADRRCRERWISLAISGGELRHLSDQVNLVRRQGLRPRRVVVGIHPHFLVTVPPEKRNSEKRNRTNVRRRVLSKLAWSYDIQPIVSRVALRRLFDLRERALFGAGLPGMVAPAATAGILYLKQREALDDPDALLVPVTRNGLMDSTSYTSDRNNLDSMAEILADLRAIGAEIVVVMMPVRRAYRDAVPAVAMQRWASFLAQEAERGRLTVLDWQTALDDTLMFDLVHADGDGRRILSARLANTLGDSCPP